MKIANSTIAMVSNRTYLERYEKSESLKMWVGNTRPNFAGENQLPEQTPMINPVPSLQNYIVELSEEAKKPIPIEETENIDSSLSEEDKLKIMLIEKFVETLTGKKIKINVGDLKEFEKDCRKLTNEAEKLQNEAQRNQAQQNQAPQKQGWGLEYDYHESYYESEQVSFAAEGTIKTADGQEISFSIDLNMSRQFMLEQNISVRAGDAKKIDPLVINYSGMAAELTTTKFSFDLDSNGSAEQISFVRQGSGFLALDINNDGAVNNGSELFGPTTGSGFAELAGYDEDNNGWIDENDSIYNKLRIWSKDAQGNNSLVALGQVGVGAIYLSHVSTQFEMTDNQNESQGQVSQTGIFASEKGTVGTAQEIDLTV